MKRKSASLVNGSRLWLFGSVGRIAALAAILLGIAAGCGKAPAPLAAESEGRLSAQIQLGTNTMRVGDVVDFSLTVDHPAGGALQVPEIARGKELVVRDGSAKDSALGTGMTRTVISGRLTSFVVGTHVLSTGDLHCVQSGGETLALPFPHASLEVRTMLDRPDTPMRGIKGLVRWPAAFPRWIWAFGLIAVLAVVAALVVKRILSKPRTILHMPPPTPPHDVALQALDRLLAKGWIEAGNVEPFYVELSAIARRYVEDRFGLHAPERTTEEFMREAVHSRLLTPAHQQLLMDFLEQSDLVKFARHVPAQPDMRSAFDSSRRFVRETIPLPPAQQEVRP